MRMMYFYRTVILLISLQIQGYSRNSSDPIGLSVLKQVWGPSSVQGSSDYEVIPSLSGSQKEDPFVKKTMKIRLNNGVQAYLISDPKASDSAAAVSVRVGSWNDPIEAPGMAHFVEHLLFMGTRKFPRESDFMQYIRDRGGNYNGMTLPDRTVYGFSVPHEGFEGGLDRFSHFFIDPLFASGAVYREKNAIHHEFYDSIEDVGSRIWRVLKATGSPSHPNAIFSCGNLESLGGVSPSHVKQWYADHYIGSNINLVILSPLLLEELCSLVVEKFCSVVTGEAKSLDYSAPFTALRQKGHFLNIDAGSNHRSLNMLWEVPVEVIQRAGIMPMQVIDLAIDHDQGRSLSDFLHERDLATDVSIDYHKIEKEHMLFEISVDLTSQGVEQVEDVIATCFQALEGLRSKGALPSLQDHVAQLEEESRQESSGGSVFDCAMDHAEFLVEDSIEIYPYQRYLTKRASNQDMAEFLDSLRAEDCLFFLVAPSAETGIEMSHIEKWMGTLYQVTEIPVDKLEGWSHVLENPEIDIRDSVETPEAEEEGGSEKDSLDTISLCKEARVSMSLSQDSEVPEGSMRVVFSINSPLFNQDVRYEALGLLWGSCKARCMDESFSSDPNYEGNWSFIKDNDCLYMVIEVAGENKSACLQQFISILMDRSLDSGLWGEIREGLFGLHTEDPDPLEYARDVADSCLSLGTYSDADVFRVLPEITLNECQEYGRDFLNTMEIQGVFLGQVPVEEAQQYWNAIAPLLQGESGSWDLPSLATPMATKHSWQEPAVLHRQTNRQGNAALLILHMGRAYTENWAAQQILSQILASEFFFELRTKQQTAYLVDSWSGSLQEDVLLQYFAIQSSTHTPQDLHKRIEVFLDAFGQAFDQRVHRDRVNLVRHGLIASLKKNLNNLPSIEKQVCAQVDALKTVSYDQVCKMAQEMLSVQNLRRLSVLIEGTSLTE